MSRRMSRRRRTAPASAGRGTGPRGSLAGRDPARPTRAGDHRAAAPRGSFVLDAEVLHRPALCLGGMTVPITHRVDSLRPSSVPPRSYDEGALPAPARFG